MAYMKVLVIMEWSDYISWDVINIITVFAMIW